MSTRNGSKKNGALVRIDHQDVDSVALFTVIRGGLLTTIQDLGRPGHQDMGIASGGALDVFSLRIANALVGNAANAATLEITMLGPELRVEADMVAALAGADLSARIDGQPCATGGVFSLHTGQTVTFGRRVWGARAYLAVAGGFAAPIVIDSRSTFVRAGFGGMQGCALRPADTLLGREALPSDYRRIGWFALPSRAHERPIRLLPGPHRASFETDALDMLTGAEYVLSYNSDRMGFRLEGPVIPRVNREEMASEATVTGAIQVPSDGQPIVLVAERQTTGGYPIIGVVISADLPSLAQKAPGDVVVFELSTIEEAYEAWRSIQSQLRVIETGARMR